MVKRWNHAEGKAASGPTGPQLNAPHLLTLLSLFTLPNHILTWQTNPIYGYDEGSSPLCQRLSCPRVKGHNAVVGWDKSAHCHRSLSNVSNSYNTNTWTWSIEITHRQWSQCAIQQFLHNFILFIWMSLMEIRPVSAFKSWKCVSLCY